MEQIDYYKILGLEKNAEKRDIKDAYRKNALKYHPDKNTDDPAAAEMMKKVNEAYAVLSDDSKRLKYDSMHDQYGEQAYTRFRNPYSEQISAKFLRSLQKISGFADLMKFLKMFTERASKPLKLKKVVFLAVDLFFSVQDPPEQGNPITEKYPHQMAAQIYWEM